VQGAVPANFFTRSQGQRREKLLAFSAVSRGRDCQQSIDWLSSAKAYRNLRAVINMASNGVRPSAVIQVKCGIGDVIWHLPFIRAIAAVSPGAQVTFFAPPSSCAQELLAAEPCVAETIHFEHGGSELRRGLHFIRLVALLQRGGFGKLWILDRTLRPASAAVLAGIPERIGIGLGVQRMLITNRGIDQSHFHDMPIEWLAALMTAMKVPLPGTEPNLTLPDDVLASVAARFNQAPRPWIVLGVAASHVAKEWPDDLSAEFLASLRRRTRGTIFLIGGPQNFARAQSLVPCDDGSGAMTVNACDLKLIESAALLRHADLFVGPDSGPMNLAAAVGTDAFALFGATPVLRYSKFIHPIVPAGGPCPHGMRRILPAHVLERVVAWQSRSGVRRCS
jgi:heptosyltransferase-2